MQLRRTHLPPKMCNTIWLLGRAEELHLQHLRCICTISNQIADAPNSNKSGYPKLPNFCFDQKQEHLLLVCLNVVENSQRDMWHYRYTIQHNLSDNAATCVQIKLHNNLLEA